MQFSLPKSKRLHKKKEFSLFFKTAKKLENKSLIVYHSPEPTKEGKVAFVAGKKVGNAVKRNKCKRLLRELYRQSQAMIKKDSTMVLIAKSGLLNSKSGPLKKEFYTVLDSKKLLERSL